MRGFSKYRAGFGWVRAQKSLPVPNIAGKTCRHPRQPRNCTPITGACGNTSPKHMMGRVTFFRTHQRAYVRLLRDPLWGWGKIARRGVDVQDVPGNHHTMMVEPNVGELARKFRRCLCAAQDEVLRA